ncbi:hypothetical protein [Oceanirhabdus seepicola]|uniref:Uncharacterized protein n=1 Tax=Oceanirhabdus seepicola TaxID=2828781 RepID=A0A9J6P6A0_9CLOT|nr:hypothetical protein [Oceanirhabdus seepicola]MCM1991317.1 hypothetical protein [Oceanirhabdus seepicola]
MLTVEQIKTMNSQNISHDKDQTRKVLNSVWKTASNKQKNKAVALGGYTDTKAFSAARSTGSISVRMTIATSLVFSISPMYLSAMSKVDEGFTVDTANSFLHATGYDEYIIEDEDVNELNGSSDSSEDDEAYGDRVEIKIHLDRNLLKTLKGFAEYWDMPAENLIEQLIIEGTEGTSPFDKDEMDVIKKLLKIYDVNTFGVKDIRDSDKIDTIVVPMSDINHAAVFMGQNCWYSVSIADDKINNIRYIASYQNSPIKAITHYAEVKDIVRYNDTNKYKINFKSAPVELPEHIPYKNRSVTMRGRKYTNFEKLSSAKSLNDLW